MRRALAPFAAIVALAIYAATPVERPTLEPQVSRCDAPRGDRTPIEVPPHFPAPREPATNPSTAAGIALGRRLFFDPGLSTTNRVSCASCHSPDHAFSVPEARTARGVTSRKLERHPPALSNLAWADTGLFWDGGGKNLESVSLAPLTHEDELGRSHELESLLWQLGEDPEYVACFDAAFGKNSLTIGHVLRALAQFQRSLVSAHARWDLAAGGALELSATERTGALVFGMHCARCHLPPLFTDRSYHNNGLDAAFPAEPMAQQRGRARITQRASDLGKYRTPALRNLSRSAPYMHDGRFHSLEQVIEHYRHGMRPSETLDPGFARDGTPGVTISDPEADALEQFLRALDEIDESIHDRAPVAG